MPDTLPQAQTAVDSAKQAYDATHKVVSDKSKDPRLAHQHGARAAADNIIDFLKDSTKFQGAMSYGTNAIRVIFSLLTQAKTQNRTDFDVLAKEIMSDLLQVPVTPTAPNLPAGAEGARAQNHDLGNAFMNLMESMLLANADPKHVDGEQAARTFLGFGINFAVTAGYLGVLAEVVSIGHLKDWTAIGEELQRSLGLGRLNRQAFMPLIENAIKKPYERKMRAKYRQDIPAAAELVKGFLSGKISETDCDTYLAQHGFSDSFIDLIKAQHTPDLSEGDIDLLEAIGALGATSGAGQLRAQGVPASIAQWRLQAHAWKRINHVRESILGTVFSQIHDGFRPASDMDVVCTKLGIPVDETNLWRQRVGEIVEQPRKRLGHGDMLFLYEAGQITLDEVGNWAAAEGYSSSDAQNLQVLFTLKAAAAHSTKSGGTAAKAAHTHNEHVAYVTDEITGLWSRAPSKTELDYWVAKLDSGDRTKHDFVTELKGLDTSGPALPSPMPGF